MCIQKGGVFIENLEYHAENQTLIGQKKRELVDIETGEVIHMELKTSGKCI